MKLPTIAPLTPREARAARVALPDMREGLAMMTEDAANRPFLAAAVAELEAALAEYESRRWLARRIPQPAQHRTRLRQWFAETMGYAEARLEELRD